LTLNPTKAQLETITKYREIARTGESRQKP
jgi:hypothetical protein